MADPEPSEDGLLQAFGPFVLFDKIGQGGMAEIFLAKVSGGLGHQRLVVIKRVLPSLSADPQFSEMLVAEAKLCSSLSHQNVVQVSDLGRIDDQLYIAMEYVEGFDLNDLLRRCTKAAVPLPAEFAFFIIQETLCALDYAHRASDGEGNPLGIIHRDVSPTNVLISCEGEVKLCDFGIARATARDGFLPEGVLKGKFAYMSPEHARGRAVDQRSDLFSAGILLWELVAGRRLYRGASADETLDLARAADIPPLPDRGLPLAEELSAIVVKALAREADERFQTAAAMLHELEGYLFRAGLRASQLRFAEFLRVHFGEALQRQRRARERACTAPPAAPAPEPGASPFPPSPGRACEPPETPVPAAAARPSGAPPPPLDDAALAGASAEAQRRSSTPSLPTPELEELAARTTQVKALEPGGEPKRWGLLLVAGLAFAAAAVGIVYLLLGH